MTRASTSSSIKFSELPKQPLEHTGVDFYGPTPNEQKLLIILDYFSRYPIVDIMNTKAASSVISRLSSLFASYGFPNSMLTDNCPPWNSTDIKLFFKARGMKHKRITPLWPRFNALTERFMQNINKCIRTSITSKTNWKENLQLMLMSYSNTPHYTIGLAPSTLFFSKQPCRFIPDISAKKEKLPSYSKVKNKQEHSQEKLTLMSIKQANSRLGTKFF